MVIYIISDAESEFVSEICNSKKKNSTHIHKDSEISEKKGVFQNEKLEVKNCSDVVLMALRTVLFLGDR